MKRIVEDHLPMALRQGVPVNPDNVEFAPGKAVEREEFQGTQDPRAGLTDDQVIEFGGTVVQDEKEAVEFGGEAIDTDEAYEKLALWLEEALTPQIGKWLVARASPEECAKITVQWLAGQGIGPEQVMNAYSEERLLKLRRAKLPIYPIADKWLSPYWQEVVRLCRSGR